MKIRLNLYQFELTFEGVWDCLFFPNVGEYLYVFPLLTEENKLELSKIKYADIGKGVKSVVGDKERDDLLLSVFYNHACLIEQKTWCYTYNEWVCSFKLKV